MTKGTVKPLGPSYPRLQAQSHGKFGTTGLNQLLNLIDGMSMKNYNNLYLGSISKTFG